jgi:hypothetical protein
MATVSPGLELSADRIGPNKGGTAEASLRP